MHRSHVIIILALLVAAGAALTLGRLLRQGDENTAEERNNPSGIYLSSQVTPKAHNALLGDPFYDPELKVTFRLPKGWRRTDPPPELRERFMREGSRFVGHFEGPGPGDVCDLVAFASRERLLNVRREVLRREQNVRKKAIEDVFDHINGVPAWINQYGTGRPPLVLHSVRVILDRGDKKVMASFTLTARSMRQQHEAIRASVQSIRLD
jgi:hypothetical protein